MAIVSIDSRDCVGPYAHLIGPHPLNVTYADLVRSAISVGYPNWNAVLGPATSTRLWALLYRASIVFAYTSFTDDNRVVPSDEYRSADRSEKGAISYYFGLFAAKLVSERLLNVPFLWHYDTYHRSATGVGPIGRSPDLIGRTLANDWVVIEAKGRSGPTYPAWLVTNAKHQARTVNEIRYQGRTAPVRANVALIAWFPDAGLSVRMDDPDPEPGPLSLRVDDGSFLSLYYQPVIDFLNEAADNDGVESTTLRDHDFKFAHEPSLDVRIGLSQRVLETEGREVESLSALALSELAEPTAQLREPGDPDGWSIGPDGVIVQLGPRWR